MTKKATKVYKQGHALGTHPYTTQQQPTESVVFRRWILLESFFLGLPDRFLLSHRRADGGDDNGDGVCDFFSVYLFIFLLPRSDNWHTNRMNEGMAVIS